MRENKCLNCGKILENFQKKFCSVHCLNEHKGKVNKTLYNLNPKKCEFCDSPIPFEKRQNKFCSSSCAAKYNNKKRGPMSEEQKRKISTALRNKRFLKIRKCVVCGKEYTSRDEGSTKKVCSKNCSQQLLKNKKQYLSEDTIKKLIKAGQKSVEIQKKVRRSKNEIYFSELCINFFKNVKCNERIFNGWDADVIIEDFKYAILWNGNWHYKEIIKTKPSLKQTQNRDKIKIKEIKKCGYTPYIIKDSGKYNKNFVETEFKKLLEILRVV